MEYTCTMLIGRLGAVQMVSDGKCDLQNTCNNFDFKKFEKYAKIQVLTMSS